MQCRTFNHLEPSTRSFFLTASTMSESGMPLLSGLPPPIPGLPVNSSACRKCNKEFNVIFTRSRKCQHCGTYPCSVETKWILIDLDEIGYQYCSACSDYQALMPRYGTIGASEAGTNIRTGSVGYDVVNVCAFCSEFLQSTSSLWTRCCLVLTGVPSQSRLLERTI